jgi:hypothetical protein
MPREVTLVASGDLRETANRLGWPAQAELEHNVGAAFGRHGASVRRAHPVDGATGHGFISSQRMGMAVFASGSNPVSRSTRRCSLHRRSIVSSGRRVTNGARIELGPHDAQRDRGHAGLPHRLANRFDPEGLSRDPR